MGIESEDTHCDCSTQQFLQKIRLRYLGLGGGEVLAFYRLENFVPMNRNVPRCGYPDLDAAGSNIENRDLDFISDYQALALFARKD